MAARKPLGWASIPDMDPPPLTEDRETPALVAVLAILGRLSAAERERVLGYAAKKFAPRPGIAQPLARVLKVADRFGKTDLRVSHFADCPQGGDWRKRRAKAKTP